MNKFVSGDPSDKDNILLEPLRDKVVEALNRNGWHKCKSIDTEDGVIVETYSRDRKLLEFTQRYSTGAGNALIITIGISQVLDR